MPNIPSHKLAKQIQKFALGMAMLEKSLRTEFEETKRGALLHQNLQKLRSEFEALQSRILSNQNDADKKIAQYHRDLTLKTEQMNVLEKQHANTLVEVNHYTEVLMDGCSSRDDDAKAVNLQLFQLKQSLAESSGQKLSLQKRLHEKTQELKQLQNNLAETAAELRSTIELLQRELKPEAPFKPAPAAIVPQLKAERNNALKMLGHLIALAKKDKDTQLTHYNKTLEEEINQADDNNNQEKLTKIIQDIQLQTQLKSIVQFITDTLENSNHWYTSGAADKATAIKNAFNNIPIEERLQLLAGKKDNANINHFLRTLTKQRAWIFTTTEANSYTLFKNKIATVDLSNKPIAPQASH